MKLFDAIETGVGSITYTVTANLSSAATGDLVNTGTEALCTLVSFSTGDRQTVFLEPNPAK